MSNGIIFKSVTTITIAFLGLLVFSTATADRPIPAESRIRRALDGDVDDKQNVDGLLDDVIGVIRQRGSVLDGSSLDDSPTESAVDAGPELPAESKKAAVAEQLLKGSRLLESLGEADRGRSRLIQQIRREAAKLLSE